MSQNMDYWTYFSCNFCMFTCFTTQLLSRVLYVIRCNIVLLSQQYKCKRNVLLDTMTSEAAAVKCVMFTVHLVYYEIYSF